MTIRFPCTGCGRELTVSDDLAGRKAKCPQCQAAVVVPERSKTAMTPAKRTKGSLLVPLLVGGVLLLLLLGAAVGAYIVFFGGSVLSVFGIGPPDDNYFLPDNTATLGVLHVDQLLASDAFKQVRASSPDFDKKFTEAGSNGGVDPNNVERVYFGSQPAAASGNAQIPNAILVVHMKQPVQPAQVKASLVNTDPTLTFTEAKIGRFVAYEGASAKPAANGPPPPSFTLPDDKRVVIGPAPLLRAVLQRDRKIDLSDKLLAAMKATDFDAPTFSIASDAKAAFAKPAAKDAAKPGMPGPADLPTDKIDGLSVTAKVAVDADVNVVALCQDAKTANDVRDGVKKAANTYRGILALAAAFGKGSPELADLLDISPQVNGSNVTLVKTVKVAPLIKWMNNQPKEAAPLGLPFLPQPEKQ